MFLEPHRNTSYKKGWIEVICGSMFSGKTEELIRRLNRAKIANQKVEIFKPALDTRYDENDVVSHNSNSISSTPVSASLNILLMANEADVIGVDEAQFFDDELVYVCEKLAEQGVRVVVAGLDMDYLGKPFGPMPKLMAIAEYVTKVHAICMVCGDLATHSFRKTSNDALVMLGEKDTYEARCRHCFVEGMKG
ncbi:MAG: thymidine kinase [Bacteroidetes bacterium]|nr:thymidine kinase [Bacteroidota bacterium]